MNVRKVNVFKKSTCVGQVARIVKTKVKLVTPDRYVLDRCKNRYYNEKGELAVIYAPSGLWSSPDYRPSEMATDKFLIKQFLEEKDWRYAFRRLLELGVVVEEAELKRQWYSLEITYVPKGEMFTVVGTDSGEKVIKQSSMEVA